MPRTASSGPTPREMQILALRATGMTMKEVAYELGIAEGTVKNASHKAFERLGAETLLETMQILGWTIPPEVVR